MRTILRFLGATLVVAAIAGCSGAPQSGASVSDLQLKLYKVPADRSEGIAKSLGAALESAAFRVGTESKTRMRVTEPFPGTVMVLAPPSVQAGVANVISTLEKPSTAAATAGSLQVHFWLVTAAPGQGNDSPALKPLGKTLDHLREALGPSHFLLDAAVSAAATMGKQGQIEVKGGGVGAFQFTATPGQGDATNLWILYNNGAEAAGIGQLSTTVAAAPGQYIVLAQAPAPEQVSGSKVTFNGKGEPKLTLFDSQGRTVDSTQKPNMQLLVVRVDRPLSPAH